jgi:hypothetical protein
MAFAPLIDEGQYIRLRQKRAEIINKCGSNVAHVFVPLRPDTKDTTAPRILFVGQATHRYGDPELDTFSSSIKKNIAILTAGEGQFFETIWHITEGVLNGRRLPCDWEAALKSIGWSNLAKIGATNCRNPSGHHLAMQAALCIEALKSEILAWRPHAVVFLTSDIGAGEILRPAFGVADATWTVHRDTQDVWSKTDPDSGCLLIWTIHPGHKKKEDMQMAESAAIELLLPAVANP